MARQTGLLEKSWEKIQEKVFTKWVNAQLIKRSVAIQTLATAFEDGVQLINLYECISNETVGKFDKNPRTRHHKIANLNIVLAKINQFIKDAGIKTSFSAEEICDGQLKLILGMIWVLIHKFQIKDISEEEMSAKEALLLWCKKKTEGYPGVKVENFSTSWQDGLAFAALIHRHSPTALDFYSLSKENKIDNLNLAFDVAEREFKIPKLLDAADIVDVKPDEKVVMTYLAYYWKAFATSQKAEVAGRRIGKVITRQKRSSDLCHDYEAQARALAEWTTDRIRKFEDPSLENTLAEIQKRIEDFSHYRVNEKPPKTATKLGVETLFANLTSMLKTENRPLYVPPQGLSVQDLDELWRRLNELEQSYSDKLQIELKRQKRIVALGNDFDARVEKLLAWIADKRQYLSRQDAHSPSLSVAEGKQRILDAQNNEVSLVEETRLKDVQTLGNEILALSPANPENYSDKLKNISESWTALKDESKTLGDKLAEEAARHKQIEALTKEFNAESSKAVAWALDHEEYLQKADIGEGQDSVAVVQEKTQQLEAYKQALGAEKTRVENVKAIAEKILALHPTDPTPINDTVAKLNALFEKLAQLENDYDQKLQAELERQTKLAKGKEDFTQKANELQEWAQQQEAYLSKQETGLTLEEVQGNISTLEQHNAAYATKTDELNALKKLGDEILAIGPADPSYIDTALQKLFALFDRLADLEHTYHDKLRTELKRLEKLAALVKDLKERAEKITAYTTEKQNYVANNNIDNTLAAAEAKVKEHREFKHEQSVTSTRVNDFKKVGVEALALAPVDPNEIENTVQNVNNEWARLAEAVNAFEAKLNDELARQRKIVAQNHDLQNIVVELVAWAEGRTKYLSGDVHSDSVAAAQTKQTALDAYRQQLKETEVKVAEAKKLAESILALNPDADTTEQVNGAVQKLEAAFAALAEKEQEYDAKLQAEKERQDKLVQLSQEFNTKADALQHWADEKDAYLQRQDTGDGTLASVEEKIKAFEEYKTEVQAKNEELAALRTLGDTIVATGPADDSFVHNTLKSLSAQFDRLSDLERTYNDKLQVELKRLQRLAALITDLQERAEKLTAYVTEKLDYFANNNIDNSLAAVEAKVKENRQFRHEHALTATKLNDFKKVGVEALSVGPVDPSEVENIVQRVTAEWARLAEAVNAFEAKLNDELARQRKIASQNHDLQENVSELLTWAEGRTKYLSGDVHSDSVAAAQTKQTALDAYRQQLKETEVKVTEAKKLAESILALNPDADTTEQVNGAVQKLEAAFTGLAEKEQEYDAKLQAEKERQDKLVQLSQEFNTKADALQHWADEKDAYLSRQDAGDGTLQGVEDKIKVFEQYKTDVQTKTEELAALRTLGEAVLATGPAEDAFVHNALKSLSAQWERLGELAKTYDEKLQAEHARQQKLVALYADFNAKAEELRAWIAEHDAKIKSSTIENTLADVQEKVNQYQEFLKEHDAANGRLTAFKKVSQEILTVGALNPTEVHTTVQGVNSSWQQLSDSSRAYNAKLQSELARQKRIANGLKQLEERVAQLNKWVEEKSEFLATPVTTDSVDNAQDKLHATEAFVQDWSSANGRLNTLAKFGEEILSLNPADPAAVQTPIQDLRAKFEELQAAGQKRQAALTEEWQKQSDLESHRKNFAKQSEAFALWVEDATGSLTNASAVSTVEEAQAAVDKFNEFNTQKQTKATELEGIRSLATEMSQAGITENQYSRFTVEDLNAKWNELEQLTNARSEAVQKELDSQKHNEALRVEFATKANEFSSWVDQEKALLAADTSADLEAQLQQLLQHNGQVRQTASDKLAEIKVVCEKLDAANVQDNKHTKLSPQDLSVMWDQLEDALTKKQNLLESELLTRKMGDVSAEQLKEFRDTFTFFDKDKDSTLNKLEFKSCLQSLGVELSDEQIEKELAARSAEGKGISFEEFTKYLVSQYKDTDSYDEVLNSFQTLANGKEFVTESDLLTGLKPEQVKYLLTVMPPHEAATDRYDYKKYVSDFFGH